MQRYIRDIVHLPSHDFDRYNYPTVYGNGEKKHTITTYQNKSLGKKAHELELYKGLPHGKKTMWHKNGQIKSIGTYVEGQLHGSCRLYDQTGKILEKRKYNHGRFEGIQANYKDGIRRLYEKHHDGVLLERKFWNHRGVLVLHDQYDQHGDRERKRVWYDDGTLKVECTELNGEYHGKHTSYYINGQIHKMRIYEHGNEIHDIRYDIDGNITKLYNYNKFGCHGLCYHRKINKAMIKKKCQEIFEYFHNGKNITEEVESMGVTLSHNMSEADLAILKLHYG